jgi:SAM-dependent methyltransferase
MRLEDQLSSIEGMMDNIRKFKALTPETSILEIGPGDGWVQIYGKRQGLNIRGLEISEPLMEAAKDHARRHDTEIDLLLGNVETSDLGVAQYDVIVARSIFEHVKDWRSGVKRIYQALKPGGLFYFDSTNKFSFSSGEYDFPLYGWLPDTLRYRLRIARQGPDIMTLGIDFNQFTYPQLRRFFRGVGFSQVFDLVDVKDGSSLRTTSPLKKAMLTTLKGVPPLKHVALTFVPATVFVCLK